MSSPPSTSPDASAVDYEPVEVHDEWLDEPEELPRRPRRRLLTPVPLALLAALLIACGFIGGALVEKGRSAPASASGAASSGIASRLAALRGGAGGAGGGAGSAAGSGSKGGAGAFPGLGGSSGAVTTGEVAYVRGNTLYVTDSQGNTVKVTASAAAKVTKTVSTQAKSIHPGSTVVVLGSKAKNGAISATSITVNSAASGAATSTGASSSSTGAGGAGAPTLFGPG
jgi:hypothetical protein